MRPTSRWRLCTVTHVEELKSFLRVLPVWAATTALSISFAQLSTFFISQATLTDRKLRPNFVVLPGSVAVFAALNGVILVPLYESAIVPLLCHLTGHPRGISSLRCMGIGLFLSIPALASTALVEKHCRHSALENSTLSLFWLLPQFFLIGWAEVFTYVGQLEFFYDEATDGTRSLSSALFLSEIGIGSWLSTAAVKVVERVTGGEEKGWLRNNLNQSRLDNFYWVLCCINAVNFLVCLVVAMCYRRRDGKVTVVVVMERRDPSGIIDDW